jgi:hypothetical protein
MKNLDAYHDGLMAKHNEDYEYDPPWTVVDYEGEGGGYLVIDDTGADDGNVYETEEEAQDVANRLNKEEMEDDDDFYID